MNRLKNIYIFFFNNHPKIKTHKISVSMSCKISKEETSYALNIGYKTA